jgi:glutamate-1-semialdehyde 2,1-aminomutase
LKRLNASLYRSLSARTFRLAAGLADAARELGVPLQVNALGSMVTPFFTPERVTGFKSALTSDTAAFAVFFRRMLEGGIYIPPSQFEAWFVSAGHSTSDIDQTIAVARQALAQVKKKRTKR